MARRSRLSAWGTAAELAEQVAEDEAPGVVVGAVALLEIRHVEMRVLEDAGTVGHPLDMIEPEGRQVVGTAGEGPVREGGPRLGHAIRAGLLEGLEIAARHGGPDHLATDAVGFFAHRPQARRVVEENDYFDQMK